jgi:hypothetical protein
MKTDPNYPRMLFHRSLPPVTVQSQSEEQALGPEWSRTIPVEEEPGEPDEQEDPEEEERKPVPEPVKPAARRRR